MDIREMERRTKLERANIRYYEKEGLISPLRHDNGYRDYSEEDVNTLLKVKLLRRLKLSIEEIRSLQKADVELGTVLEKKLQELEAKRQEIVAAQRVCERMREDRVCYSELNAAWYLRMLEEEEKKPRVSSNNNGMHPESYVLSRDITYEQPHPVKRLLAREMDFVLYGLVLDILLYGIFRIHPPMNDTVQNIVSLLLTAVSLVMVYGIEPFMLHWWGTTPGKWLMGIRVHSIDGVNLTVAEGRERTREMLWKGLGFQIPIYSWVRLWKTYKQYGKDNEPLDWDAGVEYEFIDQKSWRPWAIIGIWVITFGITAMLAANAQLPHNRGDLTIQEFAENFNDYQSYIYGDYSIQMRANGQLEQVDHTIVYWGSDPEEAQFHYEEKDGIVTEIILYFEGTGVLLAADSKMLVTAGAFVGAQPGVFWKGGLAAVLNQIESREIKDYSVEFAGVVIECDYEHWGYNAMDYESSILVPMEESAHYTVTFTMRKE